MWWWCACTSWAAMAAVVASVAILCVALRQLYRRYCHGKSLAGQVVLVTGAANGLGRALSRALARERCHVVCVDLDTGRNDLVAAELRTLGGRAHAYTCDISDRRRVAELGDRVLADVGPVDIIVNNAGVAYPENLLNLTDQHIERLVNVNLLAHFWMVRKFMPSMIERKKGHIVAIASVASRLSLGGITAYCSTKFAVNGMMVGIGQELRQRRSNVKTLTVMPGCMETGLMPEKYRNSGLKWISGFPVEVISTEYMSDRIIEAIKDGRNELVVPQYYSILLNVLQLLPTWAYYLLTDLVSIEDHIDSLVPCA